ncbi:hypothetical protein [Shouchella shacheensis]|uniref:hypothetical protein n=1 Tax=Shouchella shacheensis TaxID=1649580 RepID=UPI00073FB2BF|nr:hypothetical protein [Shouchella shacheensis]
MRYYNHERAPKKYVSDENDTTNVMKLVPKRMDTKSLVSQSGNSDVDVTVTIDTTALSYAFACYLYADGRLSEEQYQTMLQELDRQYSKRGFETAKES